MANKAKKVKGAASSNGRQSNGESVAGYFRKIFKENPKLLKGKSNAELLHRWLEDHPGHDEVPANVKNGLSNVKSLMRSRKRKGGKQKKAQEGVVLETAVIEVAGTELEEKDLALEHLEEQIDDVLMLAKSMQREDIEDVVRLLRKARNAVVWKVGQ